MIKTIDLQISPKYQIGDKLIYFGGPNKNEPIKVEIIDTSIEGTFYYDAKKDEVIVSDLTRYDKFYGCYVVKVLEHTKTIEGKDWLWKGEFLSPSILDVDSRSELLSRPKPVSLMRDWSKESLKQFKKALRGGPSKND